jgi:hypothetical protein
VQSGGKSLDLEPLDSDEKDLTNAIKVENELQYQNTLKVAMFYR